DGYLRDAVGALDDVAFLDDLVVAQQHGADLVLLEVEHHPDDVVGEREELAGHRLLEPVDARDAVADLDDAADLLHVDLCLEARQLALDDFADLSGPDHRFLLSPTPARVDGAFAPAVHPGFRRRAGCQPRPRSRPAAPGRWLPPAPRSCRRGRG